MGAIALRDVPEDVYKIIIQEQNRIRDERQISQYSQVQVVYSIIREWERCKKEKKTKL